MLEIGRLAFESSKPRWKKPGRARDVDRQQESDEEKWLCCRRCGARIARDDDRTERSGLHEHSQVNPHGFIWVFGCFTRAPGARSKGEPTDQFCWFAGYRWLLAECSECTLHLGWQWLGDDDQFWGLILERLVS